MKPNGSRRHRQRCPRREARARCRRGPATATTSAIDVMYHARHAAKPGKGGKSGRRNSAGNAGIGKGSAAKTADRAWQMGKIDGGGGRNRTGVHGFAGRCITTLPPRRVTWMLDCSRCGFRVPEADAAASQTKKGSAASLSDWSGRRVSNSRPQPWQGCALPTELLPHDTCCGKPGNRNRIDQKILERETSLELATSTLARLRSTN